MSNHCYQLELVPAKIRVHYPFSKENVLLSESGEKYAQINKCLQAKTNMWVYFDVKGQQLMDFSFLFLLEKAMLWIMDMYFGQKWWFKVQTP